ncbi:MAG: glycoside hydrolase family 3 protein [Schwartzia sp.]|nr:glycoside hydrolase family 3 protein [Schwartzia sp. (in: firmicutes)]
MRQNNIKFLVAALFCMLFVLTGCGGQTQRSAAGTAPEFVKAMTPEERANAMLARMTPAEKIGQLLMIGLHGTELNDDSRFMLSEYAVGGVILFDRNLETATGVRRFTKELQEARHGELPLLVAIDEEGGPVARMTDILPPPPEQAEIGASGDAALARKWARETGGKLRGFGFNLNFAPVADVGNGARFYSDDAEKTAAFVREAVAGYEEAGMLCTLKHFPGLGKGEADTHLETVVVNADRGTIEAEDLVPFRAMIEKGKPESFFVMTSHIVYAAIDKEHPASLSRAVMTDLLRDELGWQGVVVTDDLEMAAAGVYPFEELGVRAVEAGADLVLVCHEYGHEQAVYNGLLKAMQSGRLSESRVNESVRRILLAKLALEKNAAK